MRTFNFEIEGEKNEESRDIEPSKKTYLAWITFIFANFAWIIHSGFAVPFENLSINFFGLKNSLPVK